jgi:hypothetical protein
MDLDELKEMSRVYLARYYTHYMPEDVKTKLYKD